ncbi:MAG: hypothetical protein J07HQW1_01913 [Haloquadratum walsbyi J07HQW1]|uniref:Uncharacterized protein n=1 Tax=Haloquadratum walsbyi J07HQW1 TaxID=1238424 RepID=U1MPL8_9EURY|nr:MAG: hypothetical protein J07HQW1_01913 [Haloquadratum walsbyi J07HQW1]
MSIENLLGSLSLLFGGIVGTAVGLIAMTNGIKDVNRWWKTFTTDSVSIDEAIAADELVQIQGSVRVFSSQSDSLPGNTLTSPIRNEKCVAYEYVINSQLNDNCSIDSGGNSRPFIVSDETAEIFVDPSRESMSLNTQTKTVTGGEEMLEQIENTERVDVEPSAYTGDASSIPNPIELIEGTININETVTIVGKATQVSKEVTVDANGGVDMNSETITDVDADADINAIMTPQEQHLTLMNGESRTTALKTGARGLSILILGLPFGLIGIAALVTSLSRLIGLVMTVTLILTLTVEVIPEL